MRTPFDAVIDEIKTRGYHNHRLQEHSDIVSEGIYSDLVISCESLRKDVEQGIVKHWLNVKTPGARNRKIDLLIGEPDGNGNPDLDKIRVCIENKSVVTAHRNRDARFDDLNETLQVIHKVRSEAVMVATVIVGVADRVLNVPDKVKTFMGKDDFETKIRPRLSTGDQSLWDEFKWAISDNRSNDPGLTIDKFRKLPVRSAGFTHISGYDFLLLVPVYIDNVNLPYIPRPNGYGIDVDAEYDAMLKKICSAYATRWHL